mgnify:CR=1 FL=1
MHASARSAISLYSTGVRIGRSGVGIGRKGALVMQLLLQPALAGMRGDFSLAQGEVDSLCMQFDGCRIGIGASSDAATGSGRPLPFFRTSLASTRYPMLAGQGDSSSDLLLSAFSPESCFSTCS